MRKVYSKSGWQFLFHRVSGLILFIYFIFHIFAISTALIFGADTFNVVMGLFESSTFKFIEILVVGCVIGHGVNGFLMIAIERGWMKIIKN